MSNPLAHPLGSLSLVLACVLAAAPAAAEPTSHWYLTGRLGEAHVERDFGPPTRRSTVDGDDRAASFEVGYALHRNLGVEAGYHDLGSYVGRPQPCPPTEVCPLVLVAPADAEFDALSLSAVPRLPLTERVSLFGRLGVLDWDGKLEYGGGVPVERHSGRELLTGLGAEYAFPGGFGVVLEYERSDLSTALGVGARWRF